MVLYLQILDVSDNKLRSLDSLPECLQLHELFASGNQLTSLTGLSKHAPNLEMLVGAARHTLRKGGAAAAHDGST